MNASTEALIQFLNTAEAYPNHPDDVVEIQTHISWVFLAGDYVYKVKKPVSLGFLDFSTLEKREHFCREEVRLNRRLCPDIYEGVVPISYRDGRFVLDDDADVVEYAVKMRRLQGGTFSDRLVRDGAIDRHHIDRIVARLASFYSDETPSAKIASWGRVGKLRISTDENFEQCLPYVGSLVSRPAFEAIQYYTDRFFDHETRLMNERRASGRILDCHGDLHLEHVYLKPDGVCIYDCIEFNERLRSIDVASDAAFLAMDLDFHGRPDLSRYFGSEMAERLVDPDLLRLLDFYKCYRAIVRGKVEGMRSSEEEVPQDERRESMDRARRYFRLALRYALAGSRHTALIVIGRIGTGKSTVAEKIAEALGCDVLSSDRLRKEMAGVEPYVRGSEAERRDLYSAARSNQTYEALTAYALDKLTLEPGVLLDATFSSREHRDSLRDAFRQKTYGYCFIELTASDEMIRERLRARDGEEQSISDARLEDFEALSGRYDAPDDLEDAMHIHVSTEGPLEATVTAALTHLIRMDLARQDRR